MKANLLCFLAAFAWSLGFPAGESLMGSWDLLTLVVLRLVPGTLALLVFWRLVEGCINVDVISWIKGIIVGGVGPFKAASTSKNQAGKTGQSTPQQTR